MSATTTQKFVPAADHHYHGPTLTLFRLTTCAFCKGPVATDCIQAATMPAGVKVWGDASMPALPMANVYQLGQVACARCKGHPFYLENVKSEWAVVKRETGELAGTKKTERAAQELCDSLNRKALDAALGNSGESGEHVATTDALTTSTDESKLGPTVVIRLAGDLGNGMKRGDHLALPIAGLIDLINKTGVSTMAKVAERKTAKDLIRSLIAKKKTDDEILIEVQKTFPESNADKKHCTKYRRELFVEGVVGADLAAVGSKEHREWAQANLAAAKKGPHGAYWKAQGDTKPATSAKAAAKPAAKAATKPAPAKKGAAKPAAKPAPKAVVKKPAAKSTAKVGKPASQSKKAGGDALAL